MKTVYVVRHSKAEQNFIGSDFERKLTEKGIANSNLIAIRFFEKIKTVDAFISSPAARAKATAEIFGDFFDKNKTDIIYKQELYLAPKHVYYDVLTQLDDTINKVILFAHNPGITDFINSLGIVQLDNMPTTGIFGCTVQTNKWKDFTSCAKSFLLFDYPKLEQ
jgi:phosphohistidine phosphatase